MRIRNWIETQLEEVEDYKDLLTQEAYHRFLSQTNSKSSFSSFKRMVYSLKDELDPTGVPSKSVLERALHDEQEDEDLVEEAIKNKNLTKEVLTEILENEIQEIKERLSFYNLKQIAERHGFPVEVFKKVIPNIGSLLEEIYKINLLSFKNEIEENKLKRRLKNTESELQALKDQHVDYSSLVDTLYDITESYSPWPNPVYIVSKDFPKREIVALYSDLHAGELVSFEETHGLNEYNSQIMRNRIDSFFSQLIEYGKEIGSSKLHLKMLGDMVNGEIHEELSRNSDMDTVESLILVSDYTSKWIRRLSEFFDEITVYAISGNHGRLFKKPNFKKKNTLNFDYIAYEFIKRETREIVKEFVLPESPFLINEILDYRFFMTHGDLFKGGTGLNPISGTWGRDIEKLNGLFKQQGGFDYAEFAHFHTPMLDIPSFSGISIMVNGAIKGADEFSIGAVKAGSRASQLVYTVEENYGVKFRTTLYLED